MMPTAGAAGSPSGPEPQPHELQTCELCGQAALPAKLVHVGKKLVCRQCLRLEEYHDFLSRRGFTKPICWGILAVALLVLDYFSGPIIAFPFTFIFPVALASWFGSIRAGFFYATAMPATRFVFNTFCWNVPWTVVDSTVNLFIRVLVLVLFAFVTRRLALQNQRLHNEARILEGILPICMFCKKIRDPQQQWQAIENYISERSEAKFTHSMCPECARQNYPEIFGSTRSQPS